MPSLYIHRYNKTRKRWDVMILEKLIHKPKQAVVIGCGGFGAAIAGDLDQQGFHVRVIDKDEQAFSKLTGSFSGFEIVGDGTELELLEQVGIKESQMIVAATDNDNTNSLIAQICSRIYGVEQIYLLLNETEKKLIIEGANVVVIYPVKLSLNEFRRVCQLNEKRKVGG